jgi:VanZ family protein
MKNFLWKWGPVAIWLAFIYAGSSVGSLPHADSETLDSIIHRIGHLIEYAILGVLIARAWRQHQSIAWREIVYIVIACGLYGLTDEWHQRFVVGRSSELSAVPFDMAGGLIGAWFYRWRRRRNHSTDVS